MKDVLRRFPKENYEVFKYVISHLNKWVNGGGQMTSGDCADYTTGQTVKWPKGDISVMSLLMNRGFTQSEKLSSLMPWSRYLYFEMEGSGCYILIYVINE